MSEDGFDLPVSTFTPGAATAVVGARCIAVLRASLQDELVGQLWALCRAGGTIDAALETLGRSGFANLPDLALVGRDGHQFRLALRGDVAVDAVNEAGEVTGRLVGAAVHSWSEHSVSATPWVQVTMNVTDGEVAQAPGFVVVSGVVPVSTLRVGALDAMSLPSPPRAQQPAPEPEVQPAEAPQQPGAPGAPTPIAPPSAVTGVGAAAAGQAGQPDVAPDVASAPPTAPPLPAGALPPPPGGSLPPPPAETLPPPPGGSLPPPPAETLLPSSGARRDDELDGPPVVRPLLPPPPLDPDAHLPDATVGVGGDGDAATIMHGSPRVGGSGVFEFVMGAEVPVGEWMLLGRSPVFDGFGDGPELVVVASPERDVSRTHLEVRRDAAGVWVLDKGSANGTFVTAPGEPQRRLGVDEPVVLADGAVVSLAGEVEFVFRAGV